MRFWVTFEYLVPVQHSGQPTCVRKLAPFQGADNRALMLELGYKEPEINQYVRDEILHQPNPDD